MLISSTQKAPKFIYFIGIDVSKNTLDYAVIHEKQQFLFHRQAENTPTAIIAFVSDLKQLPRFKFRQAIFCMEHTGFYCNHLLQVLKKFKAHIVVDNPLHMKRSFGLIRGKNDKTDAIRIAEYAQKNKDHLRMWDHRRPVIAQLANLFTTRSRLLAVSVALKVGIGEQSGFVTKEIQRLSFTVCESSIKAIAADLEKVSAALEQLIESDSQLKRLVSRITSVCGVGLITAIQIIISTNEFQVIKDPKKFASYAGVAPFETSSGLAVRKSKTSAFANKKVKSLLHACAVSAVRYDPEIRAYYQRKTGEDGKPKMSAYNAIRYKLILRIFACVNQDRDYQKKYKREVPSLTAADPVG